MKDGSVAHTAQAYARAHPGDTGGASGVLLHTVPAMTAITIHKRHPRRCSPRGAWGETVKDRSVAADGTCVCTRSPGETGRPAARAHTATLGTLGGPTAAQLPSGQETCEMVGRWHLPNCETGQTVQRPVRQPGCLQRWWSAWDHGTWEPGMHTRRWWAAWRLPACSSKRPSSAAHKQVVPLPDA